MNINDDVIREWFYRLPKGYAEAPYTESELSVLADVIAEHDATIKKIIPEAVELVTEEETDVISNIKSIGLPQVVNTQIIDMYNGLSDKEKEEFNKNFRTHTIESFVSSGWKAFEKFFQVVDKSPRAGMGRGEVMILLGVKDSEPGGTTKHDIVMQSGQWEVKELSDGAFDPAGEGAASRFTLTSEIQKFYNEIIAPLSEIGDPYESLKDMVDPESSEQLKDLLRIFETRFIDSINPNNISSAREWKKTAFYNWYEGFKELHNVFYKTKLDVNVKDTRLSIATGGKQQSYWISDEDANEINKSAGNDEEASITVGAPVDNINTNIKIWFNRIMRNEFIKNPKQFIFELNNIKTTFFKGILGLIWFNSGNPEPHLGLPEMFGIYKVSAGNYRFVLKNHSSSSKYPHIQEQE